MHNKEYNKNSLLSFISKRWNWLVKGCYYRILLLNFSLGITIDTKNLVNSKVILRAIIIGVRLLGLHTKKTAKKAASQIL